MKFKVGDIVKLNENFDFNLVFKNYPEVIYTFLFFKDKVGIIVTKKDLDAYYQIQIDDKYFFFLEHELELVSSKYRAFA